MKPLIALGISIAVLAGAATWLSLTCGLQVWALFLAWASFFHCGGDVSALKNSTINNLFGAIVGWIAALLILQVPLLTLVPRASIVVAITVLVLVLAAHIKALSVIPSGFYGYAAVFGYVLQAKDAFTPGALLAPNMTNGLIAIAVAMIAGNIFGLASAKLSAAMQPAKAA
ncbi:MAG: DUF1097 domain-containing protein [Terracidiphilus sp.]|nr:DUF1097 domain-containing protein [Terracidiphilus sp.]